MLEKILLTDSAEQTAALFGNFDRNINMIEKNFDVNITNRDTEKTLGDAIVILGENSDNVLNAFTALEYLKNIRNSIDKTLNLLYNTKIQEKQNRVSGRKDK